MSTIHTNITTDRECDHCGYNLKGLPMGSKCPECGTPVRRLSSKTSGTIMDEAPTRFVRKLRLGFLLASSAIFLSTIAGFQSPNVWLALKSLAGVLWVGGIFFVTLKRPRVQGNRKDLILDNDKFRLIVRCLSLTWPVNSLVMIGLHSLMVAQQGGSSLLIGLFAILHAIIGIIAWISIIPTSVYVAELAYWSSNNGVADRLRGAAWFLAVLGSIVAVLNGLELATSNNIFLFLASFAWLPRLVIYFVAFAYFISIIQMTHVMHWVIKNQVHAAGSFERVEERRKKEEQYRGRIVDDTPCDRCGYNIIGLEPGSPCPECGTLVSHPTRPEIRDPAKTRSYHDNSPIDVEGYEGEINHDSGRGPNTAGVPYTPKTEVPDEGDIPLSMDDDPEHPKSIQHENRDQEHKIKPISFDDER